MLDMEPITCWKLPKAVSMGFKIKRKKKRKALQLQELANYDVFESYLTTCIMPYITATGSDF